MKVKDLELETKKIIQTTYTSTRGNRDKIYRAIKERVGCGEGLMNFMGKVGNSFINIYDTGKESSSGQCFRHGRMRGYVPSTKLQKTGTDSDAKSGVCRDHAICLAKIAAKICPEISRNICALTYSTPGNYHATSGGKG